MRENKGRGVAETPQGYCGEVRGQFASLARRHRGKKKKGVPLEKMKSGFKGGVRPVLKESGHVWPTAKNAQLGWYRSKGGVFLKKKLIGAAQGNKESGCQECLKVSTWSPR